MLVERAVDRAILQRPALFDDEFFEIRRTPEAGKDICQNRELQPCDAFVFDELAVTKIVDFATLRIAEHPANLLAAADALDIQINKIAIKRALGKVRARVIGLPIGDGMERI